MKINYTIKKKVNRPYSKWKEGDKIQVNRIHKIDKEDFFELNIKKGEILTVDSCFKVEDEYDIANNEWIVRTKEHPENFMAKSFKLLS